MIAQAVSAVPKSWMKPNEESQMVETIQTENEVRLSLEITALPVSINGDIPMS